MAIFPMILMAAWLDPAPALPMPGPAIQTAAVGPDGGTILLGGLKPLRQALPGPTLPEWDAVPSPSPFTLADLR